MQRNGFLRCAALTAFLTVIISLVLVLAFSFAVKLADFSEGAVFGVTQFIKITSAFAGAFFSVRGKAGIFKGLTGGAVSAVMLHCVFSAITGESFISLQLLIDLLLSGAVGAIAGIIAVNLKKAE